jgi:hypothetical protein
MTVVDGAEKAIRFGCGFIFGAIFGGLLAVRTFYQNGYEILAATVAIAILIGFLAMHFGDRFWLSMKHWLLG